MKKSSIAKILLASLSVILLNACSKSNDIPNAGGDRDSVSTVTHPTQTFELAYIITPFTSDIRNISFTDENGKQQTVYNLDLFAGGIREMEVSANAFKARLIVEASNMSSHPIGFRLEIRINGQTKQTRDFTIPTMTYTTAFAEYDVQAD